MKITQTHESTKFTNSFKNENVTKFFQFDTFVTNIDIKKNFANFKEIARTTITKKKTLFRLDVECVDKVSNEKDANA